LRGPRSRDRLFGCLGEFLENCFAIIQKNYWVVTGG
jgi:hypothetical protein